MQENVKFGQALVAHVFNSNYSGGRDEKDVVLKTAPGK
jgi:hypothetical protein